MLVQGRKVKTGCGTCKIRRVKCDEGKPFCVRCKSTGRTCDGYIIVNGKTTPLAKQISPPLPLLSRALSSTKLGDEQEGLYISFFHNKTAAVLAGYFDSSFWERLVLQVSVSEPAVRHAIAALGSLHEYHERNRLFKTKVSLENGQSIFSLEQYTKSVYHLNRYLCTEKFPSIDIILICCVLFITLESFQGNSESTTRHLLSGSKIISDWQSDQRKTKSSVFQDDLFPIFTRLKIQVKSLLDTNVLQVDPGAPTSITAPSVFFNLREARNCLYLLMNDIFDLIQNSETYVTVSTLGDEIWDEKAAEMVSAAEEQTFMFSSSRSPNELDCAHEKRNNLETLLLQWLSTFDSFLSQSNSRMKSQDLCAAVLLKIHYICGWIFLKTGHNHLETTYDGYLSYFEKIVNLSQSLVEDSAPDSYNSKHLDLWFDLGIIGPLYFTASRCRDPSIRRKAVQLLQSHGLEGGGDAEGAAIVAQRLIALEEEGLVMVNDAKDVPEYARIHVVKVSIEIAKRFVVLSCFNPNATLGGRPRFRRERIKW